MKKRIVFCVCGALLVLSGCAATGEKEVGLNKEPVPVIETVQNAAETTIEKTRKDGERFEDVIILEGMEEPVNYEHAINDIGSDNRVLLTICEQWFLRLDKIICNQSCDLVEKITRSTSECLIPLR